GAVGGPKNMIGQEMLRRLHARSEWKNLYFCGDSTVMATGAPATVVSGVGAACVVLRDLHKKDYDRRRFPKQYVHFVELPYRRPAFGGTEAISGENAHLAAAQCQGCEHPACVADCPAGVDVPGFLRRMEAQNYAGAARLLRQRNPFSEVCGYACPADALCQRRCHRRTFAGEPVRIAELERWVCEAAGPEGWLPRHGTGRDRKVAVVGAGVAGLSCAYYLALAGCAVDLYDEHALPGDRLARWLPEGVPPAALGRDVEGILQAGIVFLGGRTPEPGFIENLRLSHDALVLDAGPSGLAEAGEAGFQPVDLQAFTCSRPEDEGTVAEAAAAGRRTAVDVVQYLEEI
ncbi:MAG: FAD-dependent oxidoreductase, partial [Anaerolineaceae bacterium]|nr:FAD-dependent oxidoreductase [Anaerolineaceae bacterium]